MTDFDCNNDEYGCWTPTHAIVDSGWSGREWPDNQPSDYAYLVVPNVGSHQGPAGVNDGLEKAVPTLDVTFEKPVYGEYATALGYPANLDTEDQPSDFRYCRQSLREEAGKGGYVLNGCGLKGGASGGP